MKTSRNRKHTLNFIHKEKQSIKTLYILTPFQVNDPYDYSDINILSLKIRQNLRFGLI